MSFTTPHHTVVLTKISVYIYYPPVTPGASYMEEKGNLIVKECIYKSKDDVNLLRVLYSGIKLSACQKCF